MTLYDLIYEFFETHIFNDSYSALLGELYVPFFYESDGTTQVYVTLQTWLCSTASVISITIIVVLCCLFVYKIIKLIGGLIR